jgi:Ca2+-binding EF-hand superfamily protein
MQTADELFEGFGLGDDERASSVEFVETLIDESRLCVHAESLRTLFSKLDTDRTGLLSRDTLLAVSPRSHFPPWLTARQRLLSLRRDASGRVQVGASAADVDAFITESDKDKDGLISFKEFVDAICPSAALMRERRLRTRSHRVSRATAATADAGGGGAASDSSLQHTPVGTACATAAERQGEHDTQHPPEPRRQSVFAAIRGKLAEKLKGS